MSLATDDPEFDCDALVRQASAEFLRLQAEGYDLLSGEDPKESPRSPLMRAAVVVAMTCGLLTCPAFLVDADEAASESGGRQIASSAARSKAVLTERQAELLSRVIRGQGREQVCRELNISPKTYDNHMASARKALGVHNTKAAAALAFRLGLLPGTPVAGSPVE